MTPIFLTNFLTAEAIFAIFLLLLGAFCARRSTTSKARRLLFCFIRRKINWKQEIREWLTAV